MSIGDGIYAEKAVYKKNSDEYEWKLLDKTEMKVFTGLVRTSDEIELNLYEIKYEDGHFVKNMVDEPDEDSMNKYFIPKNNPIKRLKYPVEANYYLGEERGFTR